jgi:hypothetical protein
MENNLRYNADESSSQFSTPSKENQGEALVQHSTPTKTVTLHSQTFFFGCIPSYPVN